MQDVIVVGAGSAGAVVATRLAERGRKVLLVEAGGSHRDVRIRAPGLYLTLWRSAHDWGLSTVPQRHVHDRRMYWPRGKVLGGSSCLNLMVYIRGHASDYDAWARAGNRGWGFADVLPLFKRSERNLRGASEFHGGDGPLTVSDQPVTEVSDAFAQAVGKVCDVPVVRDFNTGDTLGAGRYQVTIDRGQRASTAAAFLERVLASERLVVRTDALALGLVIEKDRAVGVSVRTGRGLETLRAQEIVLCGGAIGSPELLLRSGIGPSDDLARLGIPLVRDLPGVGRNLQDHLLTAVEHATDHPSVRAPSLARLAAWTTRWLATKSGVLAGGAVEAGAFVKSHAAAPRPDVQFHFVPWGVQHPNTDEPRDPPEGQRFAILPGLIYPRSVGQLRLASRDPAVPPLIDPDYFSDDRDLEHLVQGVRLSREIAASAPLARYAGAELWPGPLVRSDDSLRHAVRSAVNTIFHPVGTCRMGRGEDAVVDDELRVHGIAGLRVADCSIMPSIIGGNTNAPAIMIGERAADLLCQAP